MSLVIEKKRSFSSVNHLNKTYVYIYHQTSHQSLISKKQKDNLVFFLKKLPFIINALCHNTGVPAQIANLFNML